MYKVIMNGNGLDSLSASSDFDSALLVIFSAVGVSGMNGRLEDAETGEVLVIVENGEVPYIAPDTVKKMLNDIAETEPDTAMILGLLAIMTDSL